MNNIRRNDIRKIMDELNGINERIGKVFDEECNSYDRMPENLRNSYRMNCMLDSIGLLFESFDSIKIAIKKLDSAQV